MNKKVLLPLALSTLTILLNGCGGESAKINENPNTGVKGVTNNTSCDVAGDDNCLRFVVDYPIAGLNFDCSSDIVNHFATKLEGNVVAGACKLGDNVTFYIQGADSPKKISLGTVKLDDISKIKLSTPPRIRLLDIASAMTGSTPTALNPSDNTTRVTMALVKIFQSIGVERNSNLIGDIQPTEMTAAKKALLSSISKDIGTNELVSGEYAEILNPWLNVAPVSDDQAFDLVTDLLNLSNTGVWQADAPITKLVDNGTTPTGTDVRPDGFFGCNKALTTDCVKSSSNLLHSMGSFYLLTDRQGYVIGSGQQWRGPATITNNVVIAPYILTTKVKPLKVQINAQKNWFNPITRMVNSNQPLRLSLTNQQADDLLINQGKLLNGNIIAGTASLYKQIAKTKETETVDASHLGLWQQNIAGEAYKGTIDIVKVNPSSYLPRDIFKTVNNVKVAQNYNFPLYATLNFKFQGDSSAPVDLGIVIDEHGDIRTDIKQGSTTTDMSGVCGTVQSLNADGTITDSNNQTQYRIGTTGGGLFSTDDKSLTVRMILANSKFATLDGVMFGLNVSAGTSAKINVANLLSGQPTGISLTDFDNNSVTWSNIFAYYNDVYVKLYDSLTTEVKNSYVAPTAAERELAKRFSGTVTIKIADQTLPACKSIHVKS